jgi:hypothetical protein
MPGDGPNRLVGGWISWRAAWRALPAFLGVANGRATNVESSRPPSTPAPVEEFLVKTYSLSHLSDQVLLRDLAALVARDRVTTAELLAHIAEVDVRKLYLPAAYPSMFAYCVGELHLSEEAAFKRIHAARATRRFPVILDALTQGRLHLSAVVLLAPHLTEDTAAELLAGATHKTKSEIELLLAARFPRSGVLAWVQATTPPSHPLPPEQHAPGRVEEAPQLVPERVGADLQHAPGRAGDRPRVTPLAPECFSVQFTLSQSAHDKLRYAQALLGHQLPSGDIAEVFERALDALIPQLERRKFAATARPRAGEQRPTGSSRHIPAHVKRTVWERDQGRCTFVSEAGRRCPARTRLEFDHLVEVARGGEATVAGIRLRCRAHNQFEAECAFGAAFMRQKRLAAAEVRAAAKVHAVARAAAEARAAQQAKERDVVPWLRQLGFSVSEARSAAALCEDIPDASLEERVRVALTLFRGRSTRVGRAVESPETATRGHEMSVPAAC